MEKMKLTNLMECVWTNVRVMQYVGHFMIDYGKDQSKRKQMLHALYSFAHMSLITTHFVFSLIDLVMKRNDLDALVSNAISTCFTVHEVTKLYYFMINRKKFRETLGMWDEKNSHPLFSASDAKYQENAVKTIRWVFFFVLFGTEVAGSVWAIKPFIMRKTVKVQEGNATVVTHRRMLICEAWYPVDIEDTGNFIYVYIYQLYWLAVGIFQVTSIDVLFCSWLIFACEQLKHLKEIMVPLVELSAGRDPKALREAERRTEINSDHHSDGRDMIISVPQAPRNRIHPRTVNVDMDRLLDDGNVGDNALTTDQQIYVRSAIKYWVERHKHIVRFIDSVGDTYGFALLLHMLTSTVALSLLGYELAKITALDVWAMNIVGYMIYTLAQVFLFCIFGNKLIEESKSVLQAAYECSWEDGSNEAQIFIRVVSQQCQKPLAISGANFFTVSLELFGSVCGAVVTYCMVLIQMK